MIASIKIMGYTRNNINTGRFLYKNIFTLIKILEILKNYSEEMK